MKFNFPWKRKKVLIAGLGVLGGGVGVARFFAENGANVTVTDLKTRQELKESLEKLKKFNIKYVLGKHDINFFLRADLIVKNPAIPDDSPYIKAAKLAKIPVEMEASLFFLLTPSKNIIGVTGTKGKTTTTLLISKFLKAAKYKVVTAGIPQHSLLGQLGKITQQTWVVLELSSWQLESLAPHKISPHIAVLTNIFPDHLNRYKSFQEYIDAKKIIFQFQGKNDFFITSANFEITQKLAKEAKSKVYFFSKNDLPQIVTKKFKLPGAHNLLNLAAVYKVAKILKISDEIVGEVCQNFRGVPDHLEVVRIINGVKFINDTTATIPDATIAGILAFSENVILICGGADKNLDFSEFDKIANKNVKGVVLLKGSATDKIERGLDGDKILGRFQNFKTAIQKAYEFAKKGDVILLSPAAASFGIFKNEFDRGEQFKKIVNQL